MSNTYNYNPMPPRVWSRVQNQCTINNSNNINYTNDIVYIPLTNEYVTPFIAEKQYQMLSKGNILQYKNNSANLTKSQKYSRISKGLGPTRRKCYATQNQTYTNPNTSSLLRMNYNNIPYPNQIVGLPNNPSGPYQPNVPNPFDCSSNVLQDGGTLICNAYVNPCTGEVTQTTTTQQCYPNYYSNVPGPITDLCWNPKLQSWYPRQRYTMSNSLDKWPQGYKGFVSAVTPGPPVLLSAIGNCGYVTLSWSQINNICIPVSTFNIYQNEALVKTVSYSVTTTTVENLQFDTTYLFYVTSLSNKTESIPSNSLLTTTLPLPSPTNLTGTPGCGSVNLSWSEPIGNCSSSVSNYSIYYSNETFITTVPYTNTFVTIENLNYNTSYSFYVVSNKNLSNSEPSNIFTTITNQLNIPTIFINTYIKSPLPGVILDLSPGIGCKTNIYSYRLYQSIDNGITYTYTNIPGNGTNTLQPYTLTLQYNYIYSFYITYIANNGNESTGSSTLQVDTNIYSPLNFTATGNSPTTGTLTWNIPNPYFVTGYTITGDISANPTSSSTSWSLTNLTPNTLQTYHIVSNYNSYTSPQSSTNLTTYQYMNVTNVTTGYTSFTNVTSTSGTGSYYYMFTAGGGAGDPGTSYANPLSNPDYGILYNFTTNYNFNPNYILVGGGGSGIIGSSGGGGGGIIQGQSTSTFLSNGTTYTVSVGGYGQNGNETNGGASSIGIGTDGTGTTNYYFRVTGGRGGSGVTGGGSGGGSGTIVNEISTTNENGGAGGNINTKGNDCDSNNRPFTFTNFSIAIDNTTTNEIYCGGGGGGGANTFGTGFAGYGFGGNATGATTAQSTAPIGYIQNYNTSYTGLFFGAGGGGGSTLTSIPGNGSTGVVILYWDQ